MQSFNFYSVYPWRNFLPCLCSSYFFQFLQKTIISNILFHEKIINQISIYLDRPTTIIPNPHLWLTLEIIPWKVLYWWVVTFLWRILSYPIPRNLCLYTFIALLKKKLFMIFCTQGCNNVSPKQNLGFSRSKKIKGDKFMGATVVWGNSSNNNKI